MNALTSVVTVRRALPADAAAIGDFVARHPESSLFQRPEWTAAVERGCGQRARTLLAQDPRGALVGLLPLTQMRSPLFGSALVSAGFGIGGGVLGDGADALGEAAWNLARELGCASVELRGGRLPAGWERKEGTYANFARDLPDADDAILASIPRKQRAEVRRALGFELEVSVGRDLSDHYRVYSESVRNLGTPVFPRSLFAAMIETFGDDADVLTVSRDGRPLASVLSLYHRGTVYPYWGGGTAEARRWRANDLLYYELMRHALRRGCTRFDFGRSKLGTGAFAFKKNWGFAPEPLVYAVKGEAREVNPMSPRYRVQTTAWKRLPLWLANRIGPWIARGLG
jgi:FemAB-related protein (PEP-CTERM system-associated)